MFKISYDKKITMVQGDTGVIRMRIHNYELSQGDEVRFAIVNKANPSILLCQHSDKKIVLEKQVTVFEKDGAARIIIYPYDTENLQPGKYLYEIQVKTKDGRVDTVVPLTSFTVMEGSIQGEYIPTLPGAGIPGGSEPSLPGAGTNSYDIEVRFKRIENEIIPELGTRITNVENEIDIVNSSLDNILKETNGVINVKSFKCDDGRYVQGDGVHDDTTGIQKAIDYCNENKCKLIITAGTYIISDTLTSNVYIEGYSTRDTILKITTNKPILRMLGGYIKNVRLSNTGDSSNINLKGIVIGDKTTNNINVKVVIDNIYFEVPFYDGIYSDVECDNTLIRGVDCFVKMTRGVIFIETSSSYSASAGLKISKCHIYCRARYGIYFKRGDNCSIVNNVVNDCDECFCIVEHRNIELVNNHTEHRYLLNTSRFAENKVVSVGDLIIPTESKANGQVFQVVTGGTIVGTENFDNYLPDEYGSTVTYGSVVLKHVSNAIAFRINNVITCKLSATFDSSIIGILLGRSNVTSILVDNSCYLGKCDKVIKNSVTGVLCSLQLTNSSLSGGFDFGSNSSHSYKVENTVIINNALNTVGLTNKEKYLYNKEESNIAIKTVTTDYTVDFENDKIIYVNTSTSNGRVIITFPTTLSTYGKEVTIIKATNDTNYVRINPQNYIGTRDLLKQFDSVTVKKLPAIKYMCVVGSYFNS